MPFVSRRTQVRCLRPVNDSNKIVLQSNWCAQGKKVAVSGAGNVAIYTAEKLLEFGATVLTMSDSSGYVYFEKGITREQLTAVDTHKVANRGRLSDFKEGERCARAGPRSACGGLHGVLCGMRMLGQRGDCCVCTSCAGSRNAPWLLCTSML